MESLGFWLREGRCEDSQIVVVASLEPDIPFGRKAKHNTTAPRRLLPDLCVDLIRMLVHKSDSKSVFLL